MHAGLGVVPEDQVHIREKSHNATCPRGRPSRLRLRVLSVRGRNRGERRLRSVWPLNIASHVKKADTFRRANQAARGGGGGPRILESQFEINDLMGDAGAKVSGSEDETMLMRAVSPRPAVRKFYSFDSGAITDIAAFPVGQWFSSKYWPVWLLARAVLNGWPSGPFPDASACIGAARSLEPVSVGQASQQQSGTRARPVSCANCSSSCI